MHGEQNVQPDDEIRLYWLLLDELFAWIGVSFIWPLISVYLNERLYASLAMIGVALLFDCLANMFGSSVADWTHDHFNPYYLITIGAGLDALVLFGMAVSHTWPIYWVQTALTGLLGGWNGASINSIAISIKSKPGRYIFNTIYFAQNLDVVLGTLIVGYIYGYPATILFIIATSLFVIVCINAVINYRLIIKFRLGRKAQQDTSNKSKITPMSSTNLKLAIGFLTALTVIWLMYMNWESNPSAYMVSLGIPFHLYSLLWTINASVIVIVQTFLGCLPSTFKDLLHQVVLGVTMLVISFVTLTFVKDHAHFVFSMVTLTLGEPTAMPVMPAYVNDLSPTESKGKYQGLTVLTSAIGRAFGLLFGELMIDKSDYINLFILAAAGILMTLVIIVPLHAQLKDKLKVSR